MHIQTYRPCGTYLEVVDVDVINIQRGLTGASASVTDALNSRSTGPVPSASYVVRAAFVVSIALLEVAASDAQKVTVCRWGRPSASGLDLEAIHADASQIDSYTPVEFASDQDINVCHSYERNHVFPHAGISDAAGVQNRPVPRKSVARTREIAESEPQRRRSPRHGPLSQRICEYIDDRGSDKRVCTAGHDSMVSDWSASTSSAWNTDASISTATSALGSRSVRGRSSHASAPRCEP